ncbi:hypothetical protein RJ639_040348 [Escallonia herrerae]|uniref:Auxin-responsive protein n=1 Tax=Escallonia herrerae TaxID=1293975 RepID=A0AA89B6Z5_9ASTE|nr:hypothetical protein RJ639_040348 [Escallonia herrerae]
MGRRTSDPPPPSSLSSSSIDSSSSSNNPSSSATSSRIPIRGGNLLVKVNMEGSPIGRKVDLLALDSDLRGRGGYIKLVSTLHHMFCCCSSTSPTACFTWAMSDQERPGTGLLHSNESCCCRHRRRVLAYQDKEGDWMMVGDVPWE